MIESVGIGAGGHAKVVVEILKLQTEYSIFALLDADVKKAGSKLFDVTVLGDDSMLPELYARGVHHAFMAIGSVSTGTLRQAVFDRVRACGYEIISAIHPRAVVSNSAILGIGNTIMAGAVVNAASHIGNDVIINTGSIVEHDCFVGDHVHLATGARLAGAVKVGSRSHIGAGAVVLQGLSVGENSVVGAGAVVVRDVPDGVVVMGVPAQIYKRTKEV
jgi:sugar O-acyltransferase (sialic acid O-acetyltransferase NeuD family)